MSTKFLSPGWRMPRNANQSKSTNYSLQSPDINAKINISNPANAGITNSISLWLKRTSPSTATQAYTINNAYGMWMNHTTLYIAYGGSILTINTSVGSIGRDALNLTDWVHWVLIREATATSGFQSFKLYANTNLIYSTNSYNLGTNDTVVSEVIRRLNDTDSMNSFSIYNYALSSSQVTTLYGNSTNGVGNPMALPSSPIAYYPLGGSAAAFRTPVNTGDQWLIENNAIGDYVFDFESGNTNFIKAFNVPVTTFTECTISAWVKFESVTGATQYIVGIGTGGAGKFMSITKNNNSGTWYSYNGASSNQTATSPVAGVWYHAVVTQTGTTRRIYIDGVEDANSPFTVAALAIPYNNLTLGGYNNTSNANPSVLYRLDGLLSNVQVFNTALSGPEVTTLYNYGSPIQTLASIPQSSNLKAWYKLDATATFDSSTGNWTIPDDSTNSNTGTSSGMTQANLVQSDLQTVAPYSKYAMNFDGTDEIDIPTITLANDFTISAWVTNTVSGSASDQLLSAGSGFFLFSTAVRNGGATAGKMTYYNGSSLIAFTDVIRDDNWHHVSLTYNSSTTTLTGYTDGRQTYSATYNAGTNNQINKIGDNLYNQSWLGKISNASIWDTALTPAQVTEIYNEGLPGNLNSHSAYSNLVSWWQLGENSSYVGGATNPWTFADEKGTNNGLSPNLPETALTNGVGTTANGVSSGMSEGNLVGDAPYSTANALSTNMAVTARVTGVSDAAITTGGTGYVTGTNIATTGGSGTNCTINITTVSGGVITAITINNGGSNYIIGDVLTISGGNGNATITVSGLNTP